MRSCVKMRCDEPAAATVALRYSQREVWIRDLLSRRDPNLLELCAGHADRLILPVGWSRLDERGLGGDDLGSPDLPEGLFA